MRSEPGRGPSSMRPVVLALRALGLGDLMTAVPALRALRRAMPEREVVLAIPPVLAPMVAEMDFVDSHVPVGALEPLPLQLEPGDVAVNLHGRGPNSTRLLLDAGAEQLVAFAHPDVPATYGSTEWRRREHEVHRWCRLLEHHGIPATPDDLRLSPPDVELPTEWIGATVVHPGAAAPSRRWPPERWAEVVRVLMSEGEVVLITGSEAERPLADRIAFEAGLPRGSVLAGLTDIPTLAAIIGRAHRFASSDTGPAHLATAYGTPSVVLFGPVSPSEWGPLDGPHRPVWAGRRGDPLADHPDPGLLSITVEQVVEELGRRGQNVAAAAGRAG